jgi:glyoxylase-like metal-dependent hydrolase (beta-lactamase superfamily II)
MNEIAPGLHSLGQRMGGRVHAFLIVEDDGLTLIDTLFDTDGHRVLEAIATLGKVPRDLKRIVLTHGHRSHLGGVAAIKEASGATVYAHEAEADIVEGERKAQGVTLVPMRPFLTYLPTYPLQVGLALGIGKHPPCPVDQPLRDGDRLGSLEVLHAPGHAPGHLAFWWPERRALIAGDAIATWPTFDAGWYAFNLNERQHRESIHRMADLEPDVLAVGHGEPLTANVADRVRSLTN